MALPNVDEQAKTKTVPGAATDWVSAFAHGDRITAEGTNTANGAAEGIVLKSDPYEHETEEERARREAKQGEAMLSAAKNFQRAMYSFGNYNISYAQASESLRDLENDVDSGLEVQQYFARQAQENIAYHPDGTPMTRAEITAYEASITQCTLLQTEGEAAQTMATTAEMEAQAAALKDEIARFNSGEITDINALSNTAQAAIIEDRIKAQLEAGETVKLQDVPPHLRENAVNLILSHESESRMARALETEGLTVQQWKDGALIENPALAARVMDKYDEMRDARRGELYREAGLDPNAPATAQAVAVPQGGLLDSLNALSSQATFNAAASGNTPATPTTPEQTFTAPRHVAGMTNPF